MKLKEIFDQSDKIIEHWPDFEANCFRVGGPSHAFYQFSKFAIFMLLLMSSIRKKYFRIFLDFSFLYNRRRKRRDNWIPFAFPTFPKVLPV